MSEAINIDLLKAYSAGFYGYGNYHGDYWFIGMEEGGSDNISYRLKVWDERGRKPLEDIEGYHQAIGPNDWFGSEPKPQKTWNVLIRILMSIQGQDRITPAQILEYQTRALGRSSEESALLELLPLPSRSIKEWKYQEYFGSRNAYREKYYPDRVKHIKQAIQEHQPKIVIFYAMNYWYKQRWNEIAGEAVSFQVIPIEQQKMLLGKNDQTVFAIIYHPVSFFRGSKNAYFRQAGKLLREAL